jgi:hypothetical protein
MSPRRQPVFYLGLACLVFFAITGQILGRVIQPHFGTEELPRMMARANHIYVLFIGLLLLIASQVDSKGAPAWIRFSVSTGKLALVASALALGFAFFNGHSAGLENRSTTLHGCVLALIGGVLIGVKVLTPKPPQSNAE